MGAISAKNDSKCCNEDGELTFLGHVLAHLPVDLHLGKLIVLGHVFGCLNECLIIGQSVTQPFRSGPPHSRDYTVTITFYSSFIGLGKYPQYFGNTFVAFKILDGLFEQWSVTRSVLTSVLTLSEELFCHTDHAAARWPQVSPCGRCSSCWITVASLLC